jgi:hypothetical protein
MGTKTHYELVLVLDGQADMKYTIGNTFQASYDLPNFPVREFQTESEAQLYLSIVSKSIGAFLKLRNISQMAERKTLIHSGGNLVVRKITSSELDHIVFHIPRLEHPDYLGDLE